MLERPRQLFKNSLKLIRQIQESLYKNKKCNIAFDAHQKFHYFHIEPILKHLNSNNNFNITVITQKGFNENEKYNNIKYITRSQFRKGWFNFYDIFISTEIDAWPVWVYDSITICMFHGVGLKMSYLKNNELKLNDFIFSVGPSTYAVQEKFLSQNSKIEKIGLPVTDNLANKIYSKPPKNIKIDSNKITIMYAPSWAKESENISMNREIIEALDSLNDYNVIIRPHPFLLIPEYCNNIDWGEIIKQTSNHIQISNSSDHSIYDLLPSIDILIGDISSVIYEFLTLDRPVILYVHDNILHNYDASEFIQPLRDASTTLNKPSDLIGVLNKIKNEEKSKHLSRTKLLNQTLFNIGNATETSANKILELSKKRLGIK